MRPFAQLTRGGQVRRLRGLARAALAAYDLGAARLWPLKHWNNTTFGVEGAAGRFVLRINRPGFQDAAAIRSEMQWLRALRAAGLEVPEPVPATEGELVVSRNEPGVPGPRDCTLFRWLPGRFLDAGLNGQALEQAGRLAAGLHTCARGFDSPPGFVRKRWDSHTLLGGDPGIDREGIRAFLAPGEEGVIEAVRARLEQAARELGEGQEVFGLIHADFHPGNLLFHRGAVAAIDFDECGWGWFLYDLAVMLSALRRRPGYAGLRRALLRGYRQARALPVGHERHLDTLVAARLLGLAIWIAGVADHPENRIQAPAAVAGTMRELKGFLATGRLG